MSFFSPESLPHPINHKSGSVLVLHITFFMHSGLLTCSNHNKGFFYSPPLLLVDRVPFSPCCQSNYHFEFLFIIILNFFLQSRTVIYFLFLLCEKKINSKSTTNFSFSFSLFLSLTPKKIKKCYRGNKDREGEDPAS